MKKAVSPLYEADRLFLFFNVFVSGLILFSFLLCFPYFDDFRVYRTFRFNCSLQITVLRPFSPLIFSDFSFDRFFSVLFLLTAFYFFIILNSESPVFWSDGDCFFLFTSSQFKIKLFTDLIKTKKT